MRPQGPPRNLWRRKCKKKQGFFKAPMAPRKSLGGAWESLGTPWSAPGTPRVPPETPSSVPETSWNGQVRPMRSQGLTSDPQGPPRGSLGGAQGTPRNLKERTKLDVNQTLGPKQIRPTSTTRPSTYTFPLVAAKRLGVKVICCCPYKGST